VSAYDTLTVIFEPRYT